jgi:hypothetical protein
MSALDNMNNINNMNNGRINISVPSTAEQFKMYDKIDTKISSFRDALTGNWENTILSDLFFSKENIELLNNNIRKGVYDKSNGLYLIGQQSQEELKIIMRAVYLQNSLNLFDNYTLQIQALNKIIIDYCVAQIFGEVKSYIKYTQDVSSLAMPISRPVYGNVNDKTLELKPWF